MKKELNEKYIPCSLWYCMRESIGHIQIKAKGDDGSEIIERIPYCKKHGEIAKEVLSEQYPEGKVRVDNQDPKHNPIKRTIEAVFSALKEKKK